MFRAINKDILKKNQTEKKAAVNTALDFEGFVEFLLQIAVHLYSFDAALTPAEYLQKLFDGFAQSKNNLAKLFQLGADQSVSAVHDN